MPLLDLRLRLPPGLVVDTVESGADRIIVSAHPAATVSACPVCGELSRRIHSRYQRRLLDLASHGRVVELHLQVRRFRCAAAKRQQRTFAEPLTAVSPRRNYGKLEVRVEAIRELDLARPPPAVGGEAAQRRDPSGS